MEQIKINLKIIIIESLFIFRLLQIPLPMSTGQYHLVYLLPIYFGFAIIYDIFATVYEITYHNARLPWEHKPHGPGMLVPGGLLNGTNQDQLEVPGGVFDGTNQDQFESYNNLWMNLTDMSMGGVTQGWLEQTTFGGDMVT